MMSFRKLLFIYSTMVLAMLALSSCEDSGILPTGNQSTHLTQAQADASGFFELENRLEEEEEWEEEECFEINYPVDIQFPDGSTQTVNTDEELELAIETWEVDNPDSEDWPNFVFPVDVTLEDGSVLTVMNDEEMCDLYMECWDEEFVDEGFFEFIDLLDEALYELEEVELSELICFEATYPLSVEFPDGNIQAVQSEEELFVAIEGWYMLNPESESSPALVYPIEITYDDGTADTLINDDELIEATIDCVIDALGEDVFLELLDVLGDWDDWEEDCFDINFPVDVAFPGGNTQAFNTEAELDVAIDDWIVANPDSEDWPEFVFPITVTFDDGTTQTVANDEELCDLYIVCEEEDLDD